MTGYYVWPLLGFLRYTFFFLSLSLTIAATPFSHPSGLASVQAVPRNYPLTHLYPPFYKTLKCLILIVL